MLGCHRIQGLVAHDADRPGFVGLPQHVVEVAHLGGRIAHAVVHSLVHNLDGAAGLRGRVADQPAQVHPDEQLPGRRAEQELGQNLPLAGHSGWAARRTLLGLHRGVGRRPGVAADFHDVQLPAVHVPQRVHALGRSAGRGPVGHASAHDPCAMVPRASQIDSCGGQVGEPNCVQRVRLYRVFNHHRNILVDI